MGVLLHDEIGKPTEFAQYLDDVTWSLVAFIERHATETELEERDVEGAVSSLRPYLQLWFQRVMRDLDRHLIRRFISEASDKDNFVPLELNGDGEPDEMLLSAILQTYVTLIVTELGVETANLLDGFSPRRIDWSASR